MPHGRWYKIISSNQPRSIPTIFEITKPRTGIPPITLEVRKYPRYFLGTFVRFVHRHKTTGHIISHAPVSIDCPAHNRMPTSASSFLRAGRPARDTVQNRRDLSNTFDN